MTHYKGTQEEQQALDTFIKLSRAAESVGKRVNDHLNAHDLTVSQFGALEALYHLGPMPVGQLAGKILRSSANLTLVSFDRTSFVNSNRSSSVRVIAGATRIFLLHPGLQWATDGDCLCLFKSETLH